MITGIVCFIGGILFSAKYPAPSAAIREQARLAAAWVRAKIAANKGA